ncbi:MAG: hypothetical protein WC607_00315 [Candidatus Micrarchaeia archaeon]
MKKIFLLLTACFLLAGCIESEPEPSWVPETGVTPSPAIEPTPSPSPTANATPSVLPSPTIAATPSPSPSPSPEPSEMPSCSITLQSLGTAQKRVIVSFVNILENEAEIRCSPVSAWHEFDLNAQKTGYYDCQYVQNATSFTYTATARAGTVECQVAIIIDASSYSYEWTVTPSSDAFTIEKTVGNTTTRSYSLNNTGTGTLASVNATSSQTWATLSSISSSVSPAAVGSAGFLFNAASLSVGTHTATLTFSAANAANKTVAVTLTVTETATLVPSCTTASASPATVNTTAGPNTSVITMNYLGFAGVLTPVFSCGFGIAPVGACGLTPAGSCTATCDYAGAPVAAYAATSSLNGTVCSGSVAVTVQN